MHKQIFSKRLNEDPMILINKQTYMKFPGFAKPDCKIIWIIFVYCIFATNPSTA